ncbi:hypothetical protein [Streptomyces sp. NPDC126933]|uniref:hypothetical protein n=1 Tax=unclassified Streptomyces TaxID=2593676 RepID=UPI00366205CA
MAWTQPQLAITLPLVLLAVVAAGCADPADDPRAGGPGPPPASAVSKGDCPPPEERRATPSPCIRLDWNDRVAENHGYRKQMPITEEQRKSDLSAGSGRTLTDRQTATGQPPAPVACAAAPVGPVVKDHDDGRKKLTNGCS